MTARGRITVMDGPGLAAATVSVVIPARDEAERIGACLAGLAAQDTDRRPGIYVCVNNTRDRTAEIARDLALEMGLALVVIEIALPHGGVGRARRIGHALVSRYGPATRAMLSTDADCIAVPGWVRRMEEGLRRAPVVLGHIAARAEDLSRFPETFHARGRVEARYIELSMEFERLLDPRGADGIGLNTAGGANLGLRAGIYRRLGGFASLSCNEDRDLVARAIRRGQRPIRVPEAVVHASMRVAGRARGGMADAIADRLASEDCTLDIALAPFREMLARHLGRPEAPGPMRRRDAERDIADLARCVAALRHLGGIEARRAFVARAFEGRRVPAREPSRPGMRKPLPILSPVRPR